MVLRDCIMVLATVEPTFMTADIPQGAVEITPCSTGALVDTTDILSYHRDSQVFRIIRLEGPNFVGTRIRCLVGLYSECDCPDKSG